MAEPTTDMLAHAIARAIANTFKARGLVVEVLWEFRIGTLSMEFAIRHGDQQEQIAVDRISLLRWGGRADRPLRLTNGAEVWIAEQGHDFSEPLITKGSISFGSVPRLE
jgi:hypothetical protein